MWFDHWGTTAEEQAMTVPGFRPPASSRLRGTQAITIDAPADAVWPWLLQLGQGRGGFYSYTWLENLLGCHMRNVKKIVPELQRLAVGDKVYLHPKAPPLTVTQLEPNRLLALEGWTLSLRPAGPNQTRLISRLYDWRDPSRTPGLADRVLAGRALDFAHWVMERRMFLTIKRLAEGGAPTWEVMLRATTVWAGLFAAAFLNGTLRELAIKRVVAEPWAHQLSIFTAILMFTAVVWPARRWLRVSNVRQAWGIGLFWLVLTVLTETFVIGRWISHLSWSSILASYDLIGGSLWPIVLLWIAVLPALATSSWALRRPGGTR